MALLELHADTAMGITYQSYEELFYHDDVACSVRAVSRGTRQ